jgi:hypothetical protein
VRRARNPTYRFAKRGGNRQDNLRPRREARQPDSMSAKRARVERPTNRVVLNVGGTLFHTTLDTVSRSATLSGMLDHSAWDANPQHCEEVFLDRDPTTFAHLLRLMRQGDVLGGLLNGSDLSLCAAIIAEADWLAVEGFLQHVRATAYRNATGKTANDVDDAAADAKFIMRFGSIPDALASGVLPRRYFTPACQDRKVVSLIPREAKQFLWFYIVSETCMREDDQELWAQESSHDILAPVPEWSGMDTACFSREVVSFALVEVHGAGTEVEAVLALTDEDIAVFLANGQPTEGDFWYLQMSHFKNGQTVDPADAKTSTDDILESSGRRLPLHKRHMLASEYMRSCAVRAFIEDRREIHQQAVGIMPRLCKARSDSQLPEGMNLGC